MTDNKISVTKAFKFRGRNTFYFKKKRHKPYNLKAQMASTRLCVPGGGGVMHPDTANGEAWHKRGDHLESGWFRTRKIKAGQWNGWWSYIKIDDIGS